MLTDRTLVNWCCMRCGDGKSIDHLLLHCPVTHFLWSFRLQAFGVHWIMPRTTTGFVILLASMAWEAQLEYLEFDSKVLNVDCLVGTKPSLL